MENDKELYIYKKFGKEENTSSRLDEDDERHVIEEAVRLEMLNEDKEEEEISLSIKKKKKKNNPKTMEKQGLLDDNEVEERSELPRKKSNSTTDLDLRGGFLLRNSNSNHNNSDNLLHNLQNGNIINTSRTTLQSLRNSINDNFRALINDSPLSSSSQDETSSSSGIMNNNNHNYNNNNNNNNNRSSYMTPSLSSSCLLEEEEEQRLERERMEVYHSSKVEEKKTTSTMSQQPNHTSIVCHVPTEPVTHFPEYFVSVRMCKPVVPPADARLLSSIPPTGFGTVQPPEDDEMQDEIFPACGLFLLGFFCMLPWFFGAFYVKSRNIAARTAGILSLVLAITTMIIVAIVFAAST